MCAAASLPLRSRCRKYPGVLFGRNANLFWTNVALQSGGDTWRGASHGVVVRGTAAVELLPRSTTHRRELPTVAQRTVITLIDDLDHREIEADGQTIRFAYQGIQYEMDLSEKNAKKLDKALAPFVAAARRVSTRAPRPKVIAAGVDAKAVRKWAESTGIQVSDRGRIPARVVEQYRVAGN